MPFDTFGFFCLQLFIQLLVTATAFLLVFNIVLALLEQVFIIINAQKKGIKQL